MQLACASVREPAIPTQAPFEFSSRAGIYGGQVNRYCLLRPHKFLYYKSRCLWCQGSQLHHLKISKRSYLARASLSGTDAGLESERQGGQHKIQDFREKTIDAVQTYPWQKLCLRFVQRVWDLAWTATKWLAIPVFLLSTLSEMVYTLSKGKDIFIPLGILSGLLLAKVVGNATLDVMKELQDGRAALPLILLGLFFVLLKLFGPYYPSWAAAFIPHMANAGLVKTAFLFHRELQRTRM